MPSAPAPLPPLPQLGRCYRQTRKVELGDVSMGNRMRLDAVARFLQDIAMADVCDAGLDEPAWIVRRTLVQVARFPRYLETVEVATYCWSMGKFAAERRTALRGEHGGALDTLTLWVRLDPASGRPAPLAPAFRALYGDVVAGRQTDHELRHPPLPPAATGAPWPLRACDFDLRGHVNNAACWAPVEEVVAACGGDRGPRTFEMEFRSAIAPGARLELVQQAADADRPQTLWLASAGRACASAMLWEAGVTGSTA